MASGGDLLNRFGITAYFQAGKFVAVLFLFAGFLVSIEAFRTIRIPFTTIALASGRRESSAAALLAEVNEAPADRPAEATGAG